MMWLRMILLVVGGAYNTLMFRVMWAILPESRKRSINGTRCIASSLLAMAIGNPRGITTLMGYYFPLFERGVIVLSHNKVDWQDGRTRGIVYHELGHCVNGDSRLAATQFITTGAGILSNQSAELAADWYAFQAGYGRELKSQLITISSQFANLGCDTTNIWERIDALSEAIREIDLREDETRRAERKARRVQC